nr:hypothetical protein [Tanacetum cinerariifolium]
SRIEQRGREAGLQPRVALDQRRSRGRERVRQRLPAGVVAEIAQRGIQLADGELAHFGRLAASKGGVDGAIINVEAGHVEVSAQLAHGLGREHRMVRVDGGAAVAAQAEPRFGSHHAGYVHVAVVGKQVKIEALGAQLGHPQAHLRYLVALAAVELGRREARPQHQLAQAHGAGTGAASAATKAVALGPAAETIAGAVASPPNRPGSAAGAARRPLAARAPVAWASEKPLA